MPVSFLMPTLPHRYRRPWYARPQFYLPALIVLLVIIFGAIYFGIVSSELKAEAATYDLSKLEQMESASVILDRNGKIFGQIYVENRETIPYDQLPRDLVNAVVAMEDTKFYQHSGYDLFGIVRAALKNFVAGHVRQGASTITQQLARNSFALKEKTYRRKLLEIFVAERIEQHFDKQKIMELYLNRIYFGGGLYGAEAAARGYFDKPAREMSLVECATLAGIIKSPNRLSPWSDRAAARESRNVALGRMRDLGFIDRQHCAAAQSEDVLIGNRQNAQGQTYAVDYIRQKVIEAVGWNRAMNEGFRIYTTIDSDLQKAAEDSLRSNLDRAEKHPDYEHPTYAEYTATFRKARPGSSPPPVPDYLQGAVIVLDNASGGMLALVGGRDFEHNQYDRALQARRPAGTAMTPFVFAAAFEKGMFPGSVVEDSALDNRAVMIGGTTGILGEWGPETAYEVHSCLVDALERGTGRDARANFGLQKMEAAGKTGTAYDFTDVLFAGYDSAITCAVWAGFDKPQQIFRGAFGRDIALPVWVAVMNASAEHYPPKDISQPRGLARVNICARSGLLATDKCVEKIKTSEGEAEEKTTYLELATSDQKPSEPCNIHGELHASLTRDLPPSEFPRAALAVDTTAVTPVTPKGPTLLATRDPYNSVHAMVYPKPAPSASPEAEKAATSEEMPDPTKPILKAIPVQPGEKEASAPSPAPVPTDTVTTVVRPSGSPVEVRRAITVVRPTPQASEPEVRRATPADEDESN